MYERPYRWICVLTWINIRGKKEKILIYAGVFLFSFHCFLTPPAKGAMGSGGFLFFLWLSIAWLFYRIYEPFVYWFGVPPRIERSKGVCNLETGRISLMNVGSKFDPFGKCCF